MILPEGRDMSSGIIEAKQINQLGEEIRPPLFLQWVHDYILESSGASDTVAFFFLPILVVYKPSHGRGFLSRLL